MSELFWYARLGVWTGALVLLVEAVTGRSSGPLSLIAILLMLVGFAAFLVALPPLERRGESPVEKVSVQDVTPDTAEFT